MKKVLLICCVLISLISCKSEKDKFLDSFTAFVEQVSNDESTYSVEDWKVVISDYADYRDQYSKYMRDMTPEDREYYKELNDKMDAIIAKSVVSGAGSLLNELGNFLDGVLNEE